MIEHVITTCLGTFLGLCTFATMLHFIDKVELEQRELKKKGKSG